MTIDVALYGFCAADAELKISKAGKSWTRLRVGCGKDDNVQWLSVAVFGKAAEAAATLKKSDRIYIEGTIKLDAWRGSDGVERHGLSVAALKCEQTHQIGRDRPKRTNTNGGGDKQRPERPAAPNTFYDDEIPF